MLKSIHANWSAPSNIHAFTSTRTGGCSLPPFDSLNLGSRTGDALVHVNENRSRLILAEQVPSEPIWLHQTHSTDVWHIASNTLFSKQGKQDRPCYVSDSIEADASYTHLAKQVSVVLTADCMPVLFCSSAGDEVASAHAGWRGLCNGVLEETVKHFNCQPEQILAWLGPSIGAQKFEVGQEVKKQFTAIDSEAANAFKLINQQEKKYLADLYLITRQRLNRLGINMIYGGDYCTYTQAEQFYSYRREQTTGRMASLIWFE